jgi:hypothetical protein
VDPWCAEQLAICSKGDAGAELDCKVIYEKCMPAIPPPPVANSSCFDQVTLCYQKGNEEKICLEIENKCMAAGQPAVDPCAEQLMRCADPGADAELCALLKQKCSVDPKQPD